MGLSQKHPSIAVNRARKQVPIAEPWPWQVPIATRDLVLSAKSVYSVLICVIYRPGFIDIVHNIARLCISCRWLMLISSIPHNLTNLRYLILFSIFFYCQFHYLFPSRRHFIDFFLFDKFLFLFNLYSMQSYINRSITESFSFILSVSCPPTYTMYMYKSAIIQFILKCVI